MADAALDNAVKALTQRRNEIDRALEALSGMTGRVNTAADSAPAEKTRARRRKKPMSEAVKAKLRAAYAKSHPGWKPKKK